MKTAQGNGPLSRAHFGPIPAQKVIPKEMHLVTCSWGDLAAASCFRGSLVISLCAQSLLPPAFCNQSQFHWRATNPNLTRKVPAQGEGGGSPHTNMMVPEPSSALCPVLLMLSKKPIMVKPHISASLLIPFAHHLSWDKPKHR